MTNFGKGKIRYRGKVYVHLRVRPALHIRFENIKNEGFLLRHFYDRKRTPFCHLYAAGAEEGRALGSKS